jgi:DnaJ family protein C protein 7
MSQANSLKELGNKEFTAKNFSKAAEYYTQAIAISPNAIYYTNRCACLIELKKFDKALEDTIKALDLDKTYAKAYARGAQAYTHMGRIDEALELIKKGVENSPNDQQIRREYDNLQILISYRSSIPKHIEDLEYHDALRKVNALAERCDHEIKFFETKIDILCLSNEVKVAKTFLREKEATWRKISEESFYRNSGKVDRFSNDLVNAKVHLQKALAINPDSALVKKEFVLVKSMDELKKKATDAFTSKKYGEALKIYDDAMNLDKTNKIWNSVILSNKASCLMQQKKNKEALVLMAKAVELDPQNAKFLYKKGKLEKDLQDWESAETSMRKAKTLDPTLTIDHDLKEVGKKVKEINKKDYYAILGIDKKASAEEIKKAYKELVKKWHPDKHAGNKELQDKAEKKFKEISEAYGVISDPEKRKRFDLGGMEEDKEQYTGSQNMQDMFSRGGGDPLIQMFFNQGSQNSFMFGGAGGNRRQGSGAQKFGFSNMFSDGSAEDIFAQFKRR